MRSSADDLRCDSSQRPRVLCEENPYVITPSVPPPRHSQWKANTAVFGKRWACSQLDIIVEAPDEELHAMQRQISSSLRNIHPHASGTVEIGEGGAQGFSKSRSMQTLHQYNHRDIPRIKRNSMEYNDGTWV